MAYIIDQNGEGKWLAYEERAEYLADLKEEQRLLTALVTEALDTESDLLRLEWVLDEVDRVARIHRGETDVLYFGMEYFSEDKNPGNADNMIPEGTNYGNAADFHRELAGMLSDVSAGRKKRNISWACPRGSAKTAWISNIWLTHQIVYRKKKYIVLFSQTTDVAGDFISWGKFQLKLNDKLRNDYGELLDVRPSMNDLDNKYEFITKSNTKVEAKGLGTQTRGLRHGNTRPQLFILDDLESKESVHTTELIEKNKQWFSEEMLPAMAKDGICVYLGTILAYGSLLHYVIEERRDFESRKFAAIKRFADREDLWKRWREIYRSDEKNAADRAEEFFEYNREEMLRGSEVLWEFHPYYELIIKKEENGAKAFNQEYQNEPTDEERQIFKPEYFVRFDEEDMQDKELKFYGGIDFAMGKETGDYSVIVTVAKNVDTGTCFVYDVFMERCHPDRLLQKAVEYTLKYQYEGLGVEAQMAQEWFADKLREELQNHGYPSHTRMRYVKQRTRKSLRIEALLPDIQSGKLRFRRTLDTAAMDQFEMYPMHKHDDFPDSTEIAYRTARGGNAVVRTTRKRMR